MPPPKRMSCGCTPAKDEVFALQVLNGWMHVAIAHNDAIIIRRCHVKAGDCTIKHILDNLSIHPTRWSS